MLVLTIPTEHRIGETIQVTINGQGMRLTWRDPRTLVLGDDDPRPILSETVSAGLRQFIAGDRGTTVADDRERPDAFRTRRHSRSMPFSRPYR